MASYHTALHCHSAFSSTPRRTDIPRCVVLESKRQAVVDDDKRRKENVKIPHRGSRYRIQYSWTVGPIAQRIFFPCLRRRACCTHQGPPNTPLAPLTGEGQPWWRIGIATDSQERQTD